MLSGSSWGHWAVTPSRLARAADPRSGPFVARLAEQQSREWPGGWHSISSWQQCHCGQMCDEPLLVRQQSWKPTFNDAMTYATYQGDQWCKSYLMCQNWTAWGCNLGSCHWCKSMYIHGPEQAGIGPMLVASSQFLLASGLYVWGIFHSFKGIASNWRKTKFDIIWGFEKNDYCWFSS